MVNWPTNPFCKRAKKKVAGLSNGSSQDGSSCSGSSRAKVNNPEELDILSASSGLRRLGQWKKLPNELRHPSDDDDNSSEISSRSQCSLDVSSQPSLSSASSHVGTPFCYPLPSGKGGDASPLRGGGVDPRDCSETEHVASEDLSDVFLSISSSNSVDLQDSDQGFTDVFGRFLPLHGPEEMHMLSTVSPSESNSLTGLMKPGSPLALPTTRKGSPIGRIGVARIENSNHANKGGNGGASSTSTYSSPASPMPSIRLEPIRKTSAPSSGCNTPSRRCLLDKKGVERSLLPSSKLSPLPSPTRAVSPLHQKSFGTNHDSRAGFPEEAHPLPLPPSALPSPMSPLRSLGRAEPLVSTGKWKKGKLLGKGSFGSVYRGIHSETGDMCAIKEVELVGDDEKSKESAMQLQQEITLLSQLRHPNIVHYKGSEMVDGCLNIYLELVSEGTLYKLIQEYKKLEESVIRRYTRQILLGLKYLHENNILHRDVKAINILIDQDGKVKLADFGMAKHIKEHGMPLSFKGSPYWMAPEVIMQNTSGYEFAVDIWSLGCTVIEMATGKPPWSEYEGAAAMFKVSRCEAPPIPDSLSPIGRDFVFQCLQKNPALRPTAAALLDHPFLQISSSSNSDLGYFGDKGAHHGNESPITWHSQLRPWTFPGDFSSHVSLKPSMSCPVSPRSSHLISGGLSLTRSVDIPSGFSTPPLVRNNNVASYMPREEHTSRTNPGQKFDNKYMTNFDGNLLARNDNFLEISQSQSILTQNRYNSLGNGNFPDISQSQPVLTQNHYESPRNDNFSGTRKSGSTLTQNRCDSPRKLEGKVTELLVRSDFFSNQLCGVHGSPLGKQLA